MSLAGDSLAFAMADALLSKVATDRGLSTIDLNKFQTAITEHLKSPTIRERINEDIKKLTDMVMSIESAFADISDQMTWIDNKKLVMDEEGYPMEFAPQWRALHDEYTSLMMESQLTANKVSYKIDDLLQVILPVIESDLILDVKQSSLDGYIKSLDVFQAEGRKNSARFSRLRHDVDIFRKKVRKIIDDEQTNVGWKIRRLHKQIMKLQDDLKRSSKFSAGCWDVLTLASSGLMGSAGATVSALGASGVIAGTAGLSALSPAVGIGILVIFFITFGFTITKAIKDRADQRQAKMDELATLEDEHEAAVFKGHQLKKVLDEMRALDTNFDQMVSRLSSIEGIWNMLVTDAQRLNNLLSSLKDADKARVLEITAKGVQVTYSTLKLALDQYSLAVAK